MIDDKCSGSVVHDAFTYCPVHDRPMPAPPPPVEGGPLLTFAEACEALVAKRGATALQYLAGGEWEDFPAQPWDDTWLSPQMVVQWSNHKFRIKPAPALGRCEVIAKEAWGSGEGWKHLVLPACERVAKEVLSDARAMGIFSAELRWLGPSVPAQDQDR